MDAACCQPPGQDNLSILTGKDVFIKGLKVKDWKVKYEDKEYPSSRSMVDTASVTPNYDAHICDRGQGQNNGVHADWWDRGEGVMVKTQVAFFKTFSPMPGTRQGTSFHPRVCRNSKNARLRRHRRWRRRLFPDCVHAA